MRTVGPNQTEPHRRRDDRKVTDGGRLLKAWLDERGLTISAFCELHDLDRIQVQRAINGDLWKRVSVDFAGRIYRLTDGDVPMLAWESTTAIGAPETMNATGTDDG